MQDPAFKADGEQPAGLHVAEIDEGQGRLEFQPVMVTAVFVLVDDIGMVPVGFLGGFFVLAVDLFRINEFFQHGTEEGMCFVQRFEQGHVIELWQAPGQDKNGH